MLRPLAAALSLLLVSCAEDPAETGTPSTKDAGWLATVQARMEAGAYRFEHDATGTWARSPAQGLAATFSDDGVRVADLAADVGDVRVALVGWGAGDAQLDVGPAVWTHGACDDSGRVDPEGNCLRELVADRGDGVREWWRNDEHGLEQGWTVAEPAGDGDLVLRLAVDGADVEVNETRATFHRDGAVPLRYDQLAAWDADGRLLPAVMEAADGGLALRVDTEGARFPVTVDPTICIAWMVDGSSTGLGYALDGAGDVDGDGYDDIIVGDYGSYRAYVFLGSVTGPGVSADWTATGSSGTYFGWSVAGVGDVNNDGYDDVAVGAYGYDNGNTDEGMAAVYLGSSSGPATSATVTIEANQTSAYMGYALSGAGDVNADGYDDVLVGAYSYDNGHTDEGRAFLFYGGASGPDSTADWTGEPNQTSASYGWTVAGVGDVNNDGYDDIAVGAYQYDDGSTDEGEVFVYHGSSSGPATSASWTYESDQSTAYLGSSIAPAGDVNGDGYDDVILGAHYYDNGSTNEGKLWLFHGSASGLATTATWTLESNSTSGYLGSAGSASTAGDVNGDGYGDVVVGRYTYSSSYGAFYVYHGSSAGLAASATLSYTSSASYSLGYRVDSAGDTDGDGYDDVLVGVPGAYQTWLFYGSSDGVNASNLYTWRSTGTSTHSYSMAGWSVEGAGDLNGDGYDDAVLVSRTSSSSSSYPAYVYVYHGSSSGLSSSASSYISGTGTGFGYGVAAAGDTNGDGYDDLLVGNYTNTVSASSEGSTFVYYGSSSGISSTNYGRLDGSQASAYFGYAAAGVGDVNDDGYDDVLVGAYGYDNGSTDEGQVFLFYGSSGGVDPTADWTYDCDVASCYLGNRVAAAGDVNNDGYADLVFGASGWSNGSSSEGIVYVFHGSSSGPGTTANWSSESNQASAGCNLGKGVGDVNGDGYDDLATGCYQYDSSSSDVGRLQVFHGSSSGLATSATTTVYGSTASDYFGWVLDGLGDVDDDGYDDFVVGTYGDDVYVSNQGSVSVFLGTSSGAPSTADFDLTEPLLSSTTPYFGFAVASAGDVDGDGLPELLVGAYDAGTYGYAYLYDFDDDDADGTIAWLDCDDADADAHPDADELCDGLDNDCDGLIDESTPSWYLDIDGDGYGDPSYSTTSCTQPSGYVDNGDDCDDGSTAISPADTESCNGVDDDCDGSTDEVGSTGGSTYYRDADADGYGTTTTTVTACSLPSGYAAASTDCDDTDSGVNPGANEYCDDEDDDCDGTVDEDSAVDAATWYRDYDSDGYGGTSTTDVACDAPTGYVANNTDCNDGTSTIRPGASESCNSTDDDCDGTTDEGVTTTYYQDGDSDGYGNPLVTSAACSAPTGYVSNANDCNDASSTIRPGATETCNSSDDDCDGSTDEGVTTTYYLDSDGDGYGLSSSTSASCSLPTGYSATSGDCDDGSSAAYPGATETCNQDDDDCDGTVDDGVPTSTWYQDADGDGFGTSSSTRTRCDAPAGFVGNDDDCNDTSAAIPDGLTWYADTDDDGYGDPTNTSYTCTAGAGYLADSSDCDDTDPDIHPGAEEVWYDDIDQACDEGSDFDQDGDGYDSDTQTDGDDCDDLDEEVHPGGADTWYDGDDGNCDGLSDYDSDGDGQDSASYGGEDCDDGDPNVYTGAEDNPYDGRITDCASLGEYDADQDGHQAEAYGGVDCDDNNSGVYPGATEIWYDGVDQDCDGNDDDQDGDGTPSPEDCTDTDATTLECPPEPEDTGDAETDGGGGGKAGGGLCAVGAPGAAGWLVALAALAVVRRRRAA